jgi:hypothetical protein
VTADLLLAADPGSGLWDWIWARHTNELSWYVRPLFLIPLAWASWRRSGWGITLTIAGLLTSMAWFPAPAVPDPQVLSFVEFEKEFLTGDWTWGKAVTAALAPLSIGAFCAALWRRSFGWGLVLLNAMALGKIAWAMVSDDGGVAVVVPALAGLAVGDAAMLAARARLRRRPAPPADLTQRAAPSSGR